MKKFFSTDMYGIPLWLYLIVAAIYAAVIALDKLPTSLIGAIPTVYLFGVLCFKLGDLIPFVNKFLGGGVFFALFGLSFLKWLNIVPEPVLETAKFFNNGIDYQNMFVLVVIAGSLLGMNRKVLINAGVRYFIPVVVGIVATFLVTGLVGQLLGYGFANSILYIAAPIMGGGMSAGAIPLAGTYEAVLGLNAEEVISTVTPIFNVGNIIAILGASVLAAIGSAKPSWTGNGQLMDATRSKLTAEDVAERKVEGKIFHLLPGVIVSLACYMVGMIINNFVPSIHTYAWTIILVALLKVTDVLPQSIQDSCRIAQSWISGPLLPMMMAGIGFSLIDFQVIIDVCSNPVILLLCVLVVVVAVISTGLVGKLVGFYPLESAVTAGLCMANAGGTGDIATLSAYKHMELMPFAALSSRLGGAILILVMSFIAPFLAALL